MMSYKVIRLRFKMSLYVKREDEDTASKMGASPSSGSSCVSMKSNQSTRNNLFGINDETVFSDPR